MYILTTIDYFKKWIEVAALKKVDDEELIGFLKENIMSRFFVPDKFITENYFILIGSKFTKFFTHYGIIMGQCLDYYPQGNGLAESTKRTLVYILKKIVDGSQRNWHLKLTKELWESRTTPKDSFEMNLYLLFYGKEANMPINLEINTLISMVNTEHMEDTSPTQKRINE
jgi:hypothetical protein